MLRSKQQRAFTVEMYFSNGPSVIVVQCDFRRQCDIPPRDRILDRECFLMWMDAFRATGKYRDVTMIQQFFLPGLQERDCDNEWLQQDEATVHTSKDSMRVLKAAFPE
ncbi:hypothetical protein TNCV_2885791 [Trichonephila clavipes]|nr:hypothetical protein TNCV_2885791 [Trichonephila clavipes]